VFYWDVAVLAMAWWRGPAVVGARAAKGAAMRLVLRVLFFEVALSWTMVVAGWVHFAVRAWPFARNTLKAGFRRLWTNTLLIRGAAYVVDQALVLILFLLLSSGLVEAARAVV
jgi:hypothetical protein